MAVEFRENRAGVDAMLGAPWMVSAIEARCRPIKARAEINTPVDTGRMRSSWRLWAGLRQRRALVQVYNTAKSADGFHYPWVIEKGSRFIEAQHPLGRAVDAFGRS